MGEPFGEIALVEVVGADAVLYEFLAQGLDQARAVVDSGQQHALVAQGDARIGQHLQGLAGGLGELARDG